jgi:hypothetical protein
MSDTLLGLENIGAILKDAADAVKKLADSIAHIVALGDSAWSTVSARRTRARLIEIFADSEKYGLSQGYLYRNVEELTRDLSRFDSDAGSRLWVWQGFTQKLKELIPHVTNLLDELDKERSDFVLQEAYRSLRQTLSERLVVLELLARRPCPDSSEELAEVRKVFDQWGRLIAELRAANEALRLYLKEPSEQKSLNRKLRAR